MSLQPMEIVLVPNETARVARAAFPKGNIWLSLRDELGTIYCDGMFADLYPRRGQPAYFGGIRPLISGESAPLFRSKPPCRFGDFAHTWE